MTKQPAKQSGRADLYDRLDMESVDFAHRRDKRRAKNKAAKLSKRRNRK